VTWRDGDKVRTKAFPSGRKGKNAAKAYAAEIALAKAKATPLPVPRSEAAYFDDLAQDWVNEKKAQGRASRWLQELANLINDKLAPHLAQKPARELTQSDVMAVVSMYWQKRSQATRNRYVGYVKAILEHGVTHGHLATNPLRAWKPGKETRRKSRLTLDDLRKIQRHAPGHLAWAIEVAWHIPARPGPSDLFALRFDTHVKWDREGVEVYHSKVGRWSFVQCPKSFMRALYVRQAQHQSGHLIEYKGRPVKRLDTALPRACNQAKVGYTICMYDIRHLWITTAIDQALEPSAIAHLAGTSVEMIHKNYYEPHQAEAGRVAEVMPRLSEKTLIRGKVVKIG